MGSSYYDNAPKTVAAFRNLILDSVTKYRNDSKKYQEATVSNIKCESIWPPYAQAGDPLYNLNEPAELFHEALRQMNQEGIITAIWNTKTKSFTKIQVSREQASQIFAMRGVMPKHNFFEALQQEFERVYQNAPCEAIRSAAIASSNKFVREHCDYKNGSQDELNAEKERLHTLCRVISAVWANEEDILERNFSIRLGLGSKGFVSGHFKEKAAKILDAEELAAGTPVNEIMKKHHIVENPPSVGIRGKAVIHMKNGDKLTLTQYNGAIYLEEPFIAQIDRVETSSLHSIENLTTFNSLPFDTDGIVVFTSGYPCLLVTRFMEKVIGDNDLKQTYHCGDMDAFGFKIKKDIDSKVSADVVSFRMGIDDYTRYKDFSVPMTDANNKEFLRMMEDPYYTSGEKALFLQLLQDKVTLEQESLQHCVSSAPCHFEG